MQNAINKKIKCIKLNIFLHCLALFRVQAVRNTYDESGIKTSVKAEGKTTYFIYEGSTLLGQYTDDGEKIRNIMMFLYDENGEIQGAQYSSGYDSSSAMYYYQKDALGNVYSIRNFMGNSIGSYRYDAYGCNLTGFATSNPFYNINPIGYRGYYYDNYYGGYYNLSRYYNPSMCRFFNLDDPMIALQSKSDPDGMNLYAYCNNDPVNNVDYDGRKAKKNYNYSSFGFSLCSKNYPNSVTVALRYDSITKAKAVFTYWNKNSKGNKMNGYLVSFDNRENYAKYTSDYCLFYQLAEAIYDMIVTSFGKSQFKGRTINGIFVELVIHYALYSLGIMRNFHTNTTEIGGTNVDSNAKYFEGLAKGDSLLKKFKSYIKSTIKEYANKSKKKV